MGTKNDDVVIKYNSPDNETNAGFGKVIQRYNISTAKLEHYFIPRERLLEYRAAIAKQDLYAHIKLGTRVDRME